MSNRGFTKWLSMDHDVDISAAKVGIAASILLLGLRTLAAQAFLLVIPLAAGVGSVVYLINRPDRVSNLVNWRSRRLETASVTLPKSVAQLLPTLTFVVLAGFVVAIHRAGTRTNLVYLLTATVGVAILAQLLFVDDGHLTPAIILFEILVAGTVLRLAPLYVTPGYVGIDNWTHATVFIDGIVRTGSLGPLAESKYIMAPIYHLIGATGELFFGSTRDGLYLTLGLFVPLSALFIYGTGKLLIPERWALLATAFLVFSEQFIRWGMYIIPTSLGLAVFLVVFYAVTRIFVGYTERWVVALLLAASLAIVFIHQVSTAVTIVFLGIATLVAVTLGLTGRSAFEGDRTASALGGVFLVTLVVTVASWANTPFPGQGTFLWTEISVVQEAMSTKAGFLNLASTGTEASQMIGGPVETGTLLAKTVPYIELLGFGLLLLAAVVGGLHMLGWKHVPDLTYTYLLAGGGLFVAVFGLSLFGFRALLPTRWIAFLYVSMALLGAIGLYYLSRSGHRRVVLVVFVLVSVGYPTSMAVAEKATLDNPVFDDQFKRFAYTEAEIATVDTIREMKPPASGATVASDHPYIGLIERYGRYEERAINLELTQKGAATTADAVIYREYQSSGPVTFHRAEGSDLTQVPAAVETAVCPPNWNVAYANDQAKICTPTGGTP